MGDFLNVNPAQMGGGVPLMVVIDPPEIVGFHGAVVWTEYVLTGLPLHVLLAPVPARFSWLDIIGQANLPLHVTLHLHAVLFCPQIQVHRVPDGLLMRCGNREVVESFRDILWPPLRRQPLVGPMLAEHLEDVIEMI